MKNKKINNIIIIIVSILLGFFVNISLAKHLSILDSIKTNTILPILLSFAFYQLLIKANKIKDKRMSIIVAIIAIILSAFEMIGFSINTYLSLSGILCSKSNFIKYAIKFVSYTIILYSIIKVIYGFIASYNFKEERNLQIFSNNKTRFLASWILIILLWIPYFLRFYPGNITPDSMSQIMQSLGLSNVTNHHPVFHTGFIALAMNMGKLLGNYNTGVAIYCIMQMSIMSAIFALTVNYMAKKNVNFFIRIVTLLFYALYPVHALYSMTMWKDILFGGMMLLFTINISEISIDEKEFFSKKKNIILLTINMILIFLFRNNGIYVLILLIPFMSVLIKNYRKKIVISFGVVILAYVIINGPIFKILNIQKGSIREALSIPLQQFARVTRDHKNTLKKNEKNSINNFLSSENLEKDYYEKISDRVKNNFNDEYFKYNKWEFIKLWITLGIKYPRTYVESFLCNSYGYWYPEALHWVVSKEVYESDNEVEKSICLKQTPIIKNNLLDKMAQSPIDRKLPVICMIYSIGFNFWVFIVMLGYNIYKKEYKRCLIYLPVLFLWLTCLASPVYCEFRYIYSLFTCLPVLIGVNFIKNIDVDNKKI